VAFIPASANRYKEYRHDAGMTATIHGCSQKSGHFRSPDPGSGVDREHTSSLCPCLLPSSNSCLLSGKPQANIGKRRLPQCACLSHAAFLLSVYFQRKACTQGRLINLHRRIRACGRFTLRRRNIRWPWESEFYVQDGLGFSPLALLTSERAG
jgi:hypothetical protein